MSRYMSSVRVLESTYIHRPGEWGHDEWTGAAWRGLEGPGRAGGRKTPESASFGRWMMCLQTGLRSYSRAIGRAACATTAAWMKAAREQSDNSVSAPPGSPPRASTRARPRHSGSRTRQNPPTQNGPLLLSAAVAYFYLATVCQT